MITDDDRRMFPGLTDEQIAAIKRHDNELEAAHEDDTASSLAAILGAFGYQGLRDYLRACGFPQPLTPQDFRDILHEYMRQRDARFVTLASIILNAGDPMSTESADNRRDILADLRRNLDLE